MKYLAIDIGGTFTKFAIIDENCEFYEKNKIPTEKNTFEEFINMLISLCGKYADKISGIAISAPGIIDSENGFMYNAGSIFCVKNKNIAEILENHCHVPVSIENDAKCAALAEVWKGSLAECKNSMVIIIGTAVGGAVIIDKKVLKGKNFISGEFSYIFTDETHYYEKSQFLAEKLGVPALIKSVSQKKNIPEAELTGEIVFSLIDKGDNDAIECLNKFCNRLAIQISNYQFIIDPEKIAIGGGISMQPILLKTIKSELKKLNSIFPHPMPVPEVVTCKFFNDSNLIGALYYHLNKNNAI